MPNFAAGRQTVRVARRVLIFVANVTALTRLLDVVEVFEGDFRVGVEFAWNRADPTPDGLFQLFAERGVFPVPQAELADREFDLVITAGHSGLESVRGPVLSLSHGIRYTKTFSEPGTRNPEPGTRNPGPGAEAFGLERELLLRDGAPRASRIALSHPEQLARLRAASPVAAEAGAVIGDPCYDRLRASLPWRPRYRRALDAAGRTVVVVSSTHREESLFGEVTGLYERLLGELPADEFRVVAILHPNVVYEHGPHAVDRWLAPHLRSGLVVVPPERGWRAALVAADVLLGDHGSVTAYGAALGVPTALAAFPESAVAPGSAVSLLGELSARLEVTEPLLPQLRKVLADPFDPAALHEVITSCPDEAAQRVRALCYSMLGLDEPRSEPGVPPDTVAGLSAPRYPTSSHAVASVRGDGIRVQRYPAEMALSQRIPDSSHLVVDADHPGPRLRGVADVLVLRDAAEWGADAETWLDGAFSTHPGLQLAAAVRGEECLVATRDGNRVRLTGPDDPALCASAVFAWIAANRELPASLTVNGTPVSVG
jgi:hypothetical protein